MIIGEQGNQMILAFLIASCCTDVIFLHYYLGINSLLRIAVCLDVRRGEEDVLVHIREWSGEKGGLVVCTKNINGYIFVS